jgi:sec-independent protein translocase protein TatA
LILNECLVAGIKFQAVETVKPRPSMNLLPLAIGAPGLPELIVIALIILLLFGGSKLPALMRNLGRSTNEFKRGMSETTSDDDQSDSEGEKN